MSYLLEAWISPTSVQRMLAKTFTSCQLARSIRSIVSSAIWLVLLLHSRNLRIFTVFLWVLSSHDYTFLKAWNAGTLLSPTIHIVTLQKHRSRLSNLLADMPRRSAQFRLLSSQWILFLAQSYGWLSANLLSQKLYKPPILRLHPPSLLYSLLLSPDKPSVSSWPLSDMVDSLA